MSEQITAYQPALHGKIVKPIEYRITVTGLDEIRHRMGEVRAKLAGQNINGVGVIRQVYFWESTKIDDGAIDGSAQVIR